MLADSDDYKRNHQKSGSRTDSLSHQQSIVIENIYPELDCGRYAVKRIEGDSLLVSADILKPGHDILRAYLLYRKRGNAGWNRSKMEYSYDEERWEGKSLPLTESGEYEYEIQAWTDAYLNLVQNISKWANAGEDVSRELQELMLFIEKAISHSPDNAIKKLNLVEMMQKIRETRNLEDKLTLASDEQFAELVNDCLEKNGLGVSKRLKLIVEPRRALFGTWYEMFHRSQGTIPNKSATFQDCEARLPQVKEMGFDVIYLPPIHPIGRTNRRGPNNTPDPPPDAPGSPWAIGNIEQGGHMSINPELGTIDEFKHFVEAARGLGMEIALDLTFQCSPDHPYVKEHPEWFRRRSDGTIRFAENPPKRYYDVVPFFFENQNWKELYDELLEIVMFWIEESGIKIFRVDNPHTKPVGFWEWLIFEVKAKHPETIFLAEAFTRPKEMKLLAKAGFSQSYTYFTWKNTKQELEEFLLEFVLSDDVKEYYRGNFFTNTPDILPPFLQNAGRNAFKIRVALAATLSSSYGIYNGFELCENRPLREGSEEYLDSEKYQYKVWDWNREGNIKDFISKMNKIRRENPSLQLTNNLHLLKATNENIFFFGRWSEENNLKKNVILIALNLDPVNTQDSNVYVPVEELGLGQGSYRVLDLVCGKHFDWKGEINYVKLDPNVEPLHVLLLEEEGS